MDLEQATITHDKFSSCTNGPQLCAACSGPLEAADALTGLADRKSFQLALDARLREQDAPAGSIAVLLLDLDRFKIVNDTLGHLAGDALLIAVGRRLRGVLRSNDVPARLGGDEFAVLLDRPADRIAAGTIANRIVELLSQPFIIDGSVAIIGASVGVVMVEAASLTSADMVVRQADLAMYQAKSDGRGRMAFFEPALQERAEARRLLELDLRAALALDQFELFYQPQLDVQTNELVGFEALIRWRHPVRGLVAPDAFIPLAEELGLISAIGAWVIGEACAEAVGWGGHYTVAVNVAASQFDDGGLARVVSAALAASLLPAERLELEITESALMRSGDHTLRQLNAIKALGVQVSLDDFGTGYSSLTQLRSFPFNRVKIDRSFVDDAPVIRAVSALGRSLGMRTTAEGIETAQQMNRLRADGCTDVQGYLLSRPVPREQIAALIARLGLNLSPANAVTPNNAQQEHVSP